jgi:UDP-glucose 4-epimerase
VSSYGIVKAAIEQYLEAYRRSRGLSAVIIRASNPYGPRQGHRGVQGVISTFLSRIADGEAIEIWGDGKVVRDFLDVEDLAEFCVLAGTSRQEGPYNAGSGVGTSVNEVLDTIRTVTGAQVETRYKPARSVDVPRSVLDCTLARTDFGWSARRPLAEGLRNTWEWLQANRCR